MTAIKDIHKWADEIRKREKDATIRDHLELLERALAIIADAICHGMPITKEVADVRNRICAELRAAGIKNANK
jgi:hypothetical protein